MVVTATIYASSWDQRRVTDRVYGVDASATLEGEKMNIAACTFINLFPRRLRLIDEACYLCRSDEGDAGDLGIID